MLVKVLLLSAVAALAAASNCLHCICLKESGCKPIGCHMDIGSLSCGYYQIKLPYYEDCGTPGRASGQDLTAAWKACADNYSCATECVNNYYNRYKHECTSTGEGSCEVMARNHNGGPIGCKHSGTEGYWADVKKCCACS